MSKTEPSSVIEKPYRIGWWGDHYTVEPKLMSRVWGDGAILIGIQPINDRPDYYVVRGDSSWVKDGDLDGAATDEIIDGEIIDEIEDEFGFQREEYFRDNETDDEWAEGNAWPVSDFAGGYTAFLFGNGEIDVIAALKQSATEHQGAALGKEKP